MKLLIVTQTVDADNPALGFFVSWIREFSKHVEHTEVICLKKGQYTLPKEISIHSLGKERGSVSPILYAIRFMFLAWKHRSSYDVVFVHMNQEYVVLAGWLWKLLGKRVYLWRNHYAGSWKTDFAVLFCAKVFCTSQSSYTAKYQKTMLMPVGVDVSVFTSPQKDIRKEKSILFLARIAPSKHPEILLNALDVLTSKRVTFSATLVGPTLPEHESYRVALEKRIQSSLLAGRVAILPGVQHRETSVVYAEHAIFVNTSLSGMFDKTLFEAAVSGCMVFARSADWRALVGDTHFFSSSEDLVRRIEDFLSKTEDERSRLVADQAKIAERHSLENLGLAFKKEIRNIK